MANSLPNPEGPFVVVIYSGEDRMQDDVYIDEGELEDIIKRLLDKAKESNVGLLHRDDCTTKVRFSTESWSPKPEQKAIGYQFNMSAPVYAVVSWKTRHDF